MTVEELKTEERTKCEIWTRVMGYHRPVSEYNTGKKSEYADRTPFSEVKGMSCVARRVA